MSRAKGSVVGRYSRQSPSYLTSLHQVFDDKERYWVDHLGAYHHVIQLIVTSNLAAPLELLLATAWKIVPDYVYRKLSRIW